MQSENLFASKSVYGKPKDFDTQSLAPSMFTPESMFQGNLHPHQYYKGHENHDLLVSRHSNISNVRRSKLSDYQSTYGG